MLVGWYTHKRVMMCMIIARLLEEWMVKCIYKIISFYLFYALHFSYSILEIYLQIYLQMGILVITRLLAMLNSYTNEFASLIMTLYAKTCRWRYIINKIKIQDGRTMWSVLYIKFLNYFVVLISFYDIYSYSVDNYL